MPIGRAIERSQGWHRRLTVPQFTVVTGLLVVLIGTLLLATPLCSSSRVGLWEALFTATSAITVTGLSIIDIGNDLTTFGQVFIGTTLLTQVMSNAASVALLAPVAVQLAPSLQLSPTALLITVLFGASQSFLTPVGYQTNLMVFGPGRYRFLDVTRYGVGLTLIMTIIVPALILWHYGGS